MKLAQKEEKTELIFVASSIISLSEQERKVQSENALNLQSIQLHIRTKELEKLSKELDENYKRSKTYFVSPVLRHFVRLIVAEATYNNFIIEKIVKSRLSDCIETGTNASQVIVDYSTKDIFAGIQACAVTGILNSELYPDKVPEFNNESDEYLAAFAFAQQIMKMSDYDLIKSII